MSIKTVYYYSKSCSFPLKQYNLKNGTTYTKNGMPSKFNGSDGGASFAMGRNFYVNTKINNQNLEELYKKHKPACSYETGRKLTSQCNRGGKPFNIESSDQYIQKKKNQAIGKGSMPGQNTTNSSYELSFRSQQSSNINTIRAATRRSRNSGYITPAKKQLC